MTSKLCHEGHMLCRATHRRNAAFEQTAQRCWRVIPLQNRAHVSTAPAVDAREHEHSISSQHIARGRLGQQAQQKEADREFFADILSSAATKRDAKAYLNRLKSPAKTKPLQVKTNVPQSGSYVNVGNLFRGSRAAEMSPVFSQSPPIEAEFQEQETLHVAVVKIREVAQLSRNVLLGVAETLAQLNRLSISPCVIVESSTAAGRAQSNEEINRLVEAMNSFGDIARKVDNVFVATSEGPATVAHRKLLLRPLRRGKVPVIGNIAYNVDDQKMTLMPIDDVILALTRELAGLNVKISQQEDYHSHSAAIQNAQKQVSLDRIITIDSAGGIPNDNAADGRHVFLNLEQEYDTVRLGLQAKVDSPAAITHIANLDLLKQALQLLPPSSSGLMTTHDEAANHRRPATDNTASIVGTRRSKNALIHNLLTDKPAYSSSLPLGRLGKSGINNNREAPSTISHSSFVKRGMPVTILPNPFETPWTAESPRLRLTDPRLDFGRLVYLIEDSFNRKLDVEDYLHRINDRIAGVIVAGEYEGGAILTWETPPSNPTAIPVPYLDKFAVLKRSQGAGGVADIVFNAMVRSCFPNGVCWRSRKDNPVNKWYFERSRGTWKIPELNWTMFWTTPGLELDGGVFRDYEGVCRGVKPSWADTKIAAD